MIRRGCERKGKKRKDVPPGKCQCAYLSSGWPRLHVTLSMKIFQNVSLQMYFVIIRLLNHDHSELLPNFKVCDHNHPEDTGL